MNSQLSFYILKLNNGLIKPIWKVNT